MQITSDSAQPKNHAALICECTGQIRKRHVSMSAPGAGYGPSGVPPSNALSLAVQRLPFHQVVMGSTRA